ncbi:HicB family protein [Levilactobacillus brevis]|uniref:type II toxin-antitoxin system HicB family antitoxin n=1 Tax=Levilactobacillus brevis TaxID=1580 RepID=UPI0004171FF7|nr:type II toxin-antitoxin system HicB family antitoxin [Levilactobacillus brevis]ATU69494.1 HicB family protein [Levilactobacillus brevis]KID42943.1 Phage-related protein [Levilactobacillus brevis]
MKESKVVYPIIITKDDNDSAVPYLVQIPALDGYTQGTSIANAIDMARDYIGLAVMDMEDSDAAIPNSSYDLPTASKDDVVTLVDVDVTAYRRQHDNKVVKKTLTIPNYLNELGKENNVNFSELLTNSLKEKLNVL